MQKLYFLIILIFFNISVCFAQSTITLQPDSATGKDALLHGLSSEVNKNYGKNGQLASDSWTFSGEHGILRSVIGFDLKQVPENAIITSAKLSLFSWDSNVNSLGLHWFSDGSNASWLERVTSNWDESTVTWNNQPSTTPANRVNLLESTSQTQNYLDINVTQLIQDMVNKPDSSFGFMLKLQAEDGMRRMNFCSSNHINHAYHPKLVVTYTLPTDLSITLQPDSATGKDALLHGLSSEVNRNYGKNGQLASDSWTFGGEHGILRSVIGFDLKQVPENAIITSAKLSLYSWDSNVNSLGLHWFSDGSNASWLERVTSNWNESTVTWNNQPSTTLANRVTLLESTSQTQDYLDINVTQLVQDMVNKPDSSFGFMLKLQAEDGMRRMNFCSSNHINHAYHPKLVVTYTLSSKAPTEIDKIKLQDAQFLIYPNPTTDYLNIQLINFVSANQLKFVLVNCLGRTIKQVSLNGEQTYVDLKSIDTGIYIYQLLDDNNLLKSGKIVVRK